MSNSARILIVCENSRKAETYALALTAAGADPESMAVVTPGTSDADPEALAAQSTGIVLCGGPDVEPERYGEDPLPNAGLSLMPELDRLEWRVLAVARERRIPVWAICRGLQVLNVFLEGSLWQDLPSQLPGILNHDVPHPHDALAHEVRVADVHHPFVERLTVENPRVNTRHHQGIKRLAPELMVLGTSPDGVVEAVGGRSEQVTEAWWLRGVQWHPENLTALELQRQLFVDFVIATRRRAQIERQAAATRRAS